MGGGRSLQRVQCPHPTHPGASIESGETGRPGHGWGANACLTWEKGPQGLPAGGGPFPPTHVCEVLRTAGGAARGQGTKGWAFRAQHVEAGVRGGAGPGSMHWALCIVWVSWAPTACRGQGRKGLQREEHISKCLLGLALSTVNHVSDMGRAPRVPWPPQVECRPAQPLPPPAAVAGGCAGWWRRCVLTWGAGQCLYQMPLDLPPGGARIRAEARFGTWSSI